MALDNSPRTDAKGQTRSEADEGDDQPPIDSTFLNGAFQPADRRRDHQGAGDDQPRSQDSFAKSAAPRANWPISEDKSDQQEIEEVDGWHRATRVLGRSDEQAQHADRGPHQRLLECITWPPTGTH